jgi:branched-chain amino acid transport system permease protein
VVVVPGRSEFWGFAGTTALVYVLESLSLVLLVGWGGQVSLMNGAYVGIGAFSTATLAQHGVSLPLAILSASAITMVVGAIAGLPALRLSGLQFAVASVAFAEAATAWLFLNPHLSGQLPRGKIFGIDLFESSHLYLVLLPVTLVCYLLVWNVRRSSYGLLLFTARDAPDTLAHFGVSPHRIRMGAFLLASFIAGIGGAFYGILLTSFQASDFDLQLGIALLLYAVVGGVESLAGPIIAGFLFGVLPQIIQGHSGATSSAWPEVISGVVVVALIALRPQGLASLLPTFRSKGFGLSSSADGRSVRLGRFAPVLAPDTGFGVTPPIGRNGSADAPVGTVVTNGSDGSSTAPPRESR